MATYDLTDDDVVVIVGSGAGGGTLAHELCLQGAKVVLFEAGPRQSGVYARFSSGSLQLLDAEGKVARTAPPGTALIAALRPRADELVWLVTALDDAGLAAGVEALKRDRLRNAFAVAASRDGVQKLPL